MREIRFEEVYARTYADLVRFVVRRRPAADRDSAEDIVAEAFVVAWRRRDDLPGDPEEARAWLFGITRRLLLAQHRADARGPAPAVGISEHAAGPEGFVATTVDLVNAWRRLNPAQQEALSLTVWEGLTSAQAARVLGISAVAFRIRLSRARRLLESHLAPSRSATASARQLSARQLSARQLSARQSSARRSSAPGSGGHA
ncbi:RNA polymerase sigma factor [Symbioplanes lichenis]|uniref:RNA polymerase sigma factor n=1 Tax=Symbioplanes lichenis TaxID=1629072 RepID=UPI002739A775|nr:sigma-70 family RNA polymerase sigma factor [Actinoplanes lichenis]